MYDEGLLTVALLGVVGTWEKWKKGMNKRRRLILEEAQHHIRFEPIHVKLEMAPVRHAQQMQTSGAVERAESERVLSKTY